MDAFKSRSTFEIPGTKINVKNSQIIVSSGIASVDDLIGGGFPVGTITLLEEDRHGSYANIMLKYFLAEGIVNKHKCFVASMDKDSKQIINELPAPIDADPEPEVKQAQDAKMVIAFRYENIPRNNDCTGDNKIRHYDLSKNMPENLIESTDINCWSFEEDVSSYSQKFSNPAYGDLLKKIHKTIVDGQHRLGDKSARQNIVRIGIHAAGSPLWFSNNADNNDLQMFFYFLRAIVRQAYAVAFITVPSYLHTENTMHRCIHSSDLAIKLDAFSGTHLEDNTFLSEYHGFFMVTKLAAVNTFLSLIPAKVEFVFQLRRKKFVVKTLHLPPDVSLQEDNKKKGPPSIGCGSSDKHLLEF